MTAVTTSSHTQRLDRAALETGVMMTTVGAARSVILTAEDKTAAAHHETPLQIRIESEAPPGRPRLLPERDRPANTRTPTAVDAAVGTRLRDRRIEIGMSLSELSRLVGVSQPQMCRYERGCTRVAASRLIALSAALGISVHALTSGEQAERDEDGVADAELHSLAQAFARIDCEAQRSALIEFAWSIAAQQAR